MPPGEGAESVKYDSGQPKRLIALTIGFRPSQARPNPTATATRAAEGNGTRDPRGRDAVAGADARAGGAGAVVSVLVRPSIGVEPVAPAGPAAGTVRARRAGGVSTEGARRVSQLNSEK